MPSGKVHDRITLLTAALSIPAWYLAAPSLDVPSYCAGMAAYLFSGFYLSDDLDTRSVALRRWGPMGWLWYPYQRLVPHRSWISHGVGIGPILRVVYFAAAAWALMRAALWLIDVWIVPMDRGVLLARAAFWLARLVCLHPAWAQWMLGGLVLGGAMHSFADALWSAAKRAL